MDFYVIINTYKRPEMVKRLCAQMLAQRPNTKIVVYNDGGEHLEIDGVEVKWVNHHGRELYYKLIELNFNDVIGEKFDYYIKIDDDMQICDGFFDKIETIYHHKAITLNILRDHRTVMWGSREPKEYNQHLLDSDWVDLNFVCKYDFVLLISMLRLHPPIYETSSGVARQITRFLRMMGCKMMQVKESLVYHGDHESKMNPLRKKRGEEKLISIHEHNPTSTQNRTASKPKPIQ